MICEKPGLKPKPGPAKPQFGLRAGLRIFASLSPLKPGPSLGFGPSPSPHITRPTAANDGQRRPTQVNAGQHRSTQAHSSQQRLMQAHNSQRRPTKPTKANTGLAASTQANF